MLAHFGRAPGRHAVSRLYLSENYPDKATTKQHNLAKISTKTFRKLDRDMLQGNKSLHDQASASSVGGQRRWSVTPAYALPGLSEVLLASTLPAIWRFSRSITMQILVKMMGWYIQF